MKIKDNIGIHVLAYILRTQYIVLIVIIIIFIIVVVIVASTVKFATGSGNRAQYL